MNPTASLESLLADSIEDLLSDQSDLKTVRRIEAGESPDPLWQQLMASGYADALVPEGQGGSGLSLSQAAPIFLACGRHALPLPLGQTLAVRAALAQHGLAVPPGPLTIAGDAVCHGDGGIEALAVPYGATAAWVLVSDAQSGWLLPVAPARRSAAGDPAGAAADLRWDCLPQEALQWRDGGTSDGQPTDWRALGAAITAAQIAGAMERISEMTVAYANERKQFGKPIGKLQAIQQQVSVLAEQVAACRSAARIGLSPSEGESWRVDPLRGAVAKARTAEAVVAVAGIAHAVHGAIGISEEYDLQMLTRRLHAWRMQYGSEGYWNARVGAALLQDDRPTARFIQQRIAPTPAAAI